MEWLRRLWYLLNRRKLERELRHEMEVHREMMGDAKQFGNTLRLREESGDVWGWNWLDDFQRDFIWTFRSLRRTPLFMLSAVLILAIGIGLNLTAFQIGNALFLSPLPLKDLDSLVRFDRKSPRFQTNEVPYAAIQSIAADSDVLSVVMSQKKTTVLWGDEAQAQACAFVSSNWFSGMGYGAVQGRVLSEGIDDLPGADPAIVISEWFWKQKLGGTPGIVGGAIRINGRRATIVGIAPSNFEGTSPSEARVWLPIEQIAYFMPGSDLLTRWDAGPEMFARLKPGVSPSVARDALRPVIASLVSQHPESFHAGEWLEPYTGRTRFRDPAFAKGDQAFLVFLTVLTGITLLVACANLGNLVLSRNVARMHEIHIRVALGAGRSKVMRHLITESVVLAGLGCIAGVAVCHIALRAFMLATDIPVLSSLALDWRAAVATLITGLFVAAAVGLMPAWRLSREEAGLPLKSGPYTSTRGVSQTRARNVLVGLQVMCSCVLLIVGGLIVREMQLRTARPHIAFENVAVMDPALDQFGIRREAAREYWRAVVGVLASSPQVDRVSIVESAPFGPTSEQGSYLDAPGLSVVSNRVDASFFDLFGIPVIAGRTFESGDDPNTSVIISRTLAEKMYGGLEAVGKRFPKTSPTATIVGIVDDAQTMNPNDTDGAQRYLRLLPEAFGDYRLVVRAKTDPRLLLPLLKTAAQSVGRNVLPEIRLLRDDYEQRVRVDRTLDLTIVAIALIALSIASLGIFGVVSYSVALRRKEIGIRLAVGANRFAIVALILSDLLRTVVPAILLGIGISELSRTILRGFFFMKTSDPLVLSGIVVLMLACTGLAALLPTLRALRTNAIDVLKWDS